MREAVGGSLLMNLVVIFTGIVIVFFVGILTYSKAYRVKNRIVEIIEKYGAYEVLDGTTNLVTDEINPDLKAAGYNTANPTKCDDIRKDLIEGDKAKYKENNLSSNKNKTYGYNYCVFEVTGNSTNESGKYYVVVTFVHFEFPVIGDLLTIPVYSETKMLGKNYNY